jgi:hypothetical protein
MLSLVTFAIIEAAAIEMLNSSPFIIGKIGAGDFCTLSASVRTICGVILRLLIAFSNTAILAFPREISSIFLELTLATE